MKRNLPAPDIRSPLISPLLLREARERANLPREVVAADMGLPRATVSAYERGTICPPGNVLVQLASLYGVRAGQLCSTDATPSVNAEQRDQLRRLLNRAGGRA